MTVRVCTVEQRNADGEIIGRCSVPLAVEHEDHVNAFGEPFENRLESNAEWLRRKKNRHCVEPWAALPDGSEIPGAAVKVVARLERLGARVDVYRCTVGVDETRFAEDGKQGAKGELKKEAFEMHEFLVIGREAQGDEPLRVMACWELALTDGAKPALAYAQTYAPPARQYHTTVTPLLAWLTSEESLR